MNMDEDGIRVVGDLAHTLQLSERDLSSETLRLPRYRALYVDSRLREEGGVTV